jgi:hypothetical protein
MVGPSFASWVPLLQTLPLRNHLDLKIDYIKDPYAISQWGNRETRNAQYGSADCGDRRGDAAGATPGCPFDTISFSNMLKRE